MKIDGKPMIIHPQEEWERANSVTQGAKEELKALRIQHEEACNHFLRRERELVSVMEAGDSVMKHLQEWGPQETSMPTDPAYGIADPIMHQDPYHSQAGNR